MLTKKKEKNMIRKNIFDGDSYYVQFAQKIYERYKSREWFTYADIMADYQGLSSAKELICNVSKNEFYGELKKAFCDIRKVISDKIDCECLKEDGNNRNKRFCYIGDDDDPLADMRNAKVIKDLKLYWQFCQDSAGFFPISWLEYFFKDSRDLLEIKTKRQKGEQILNSSLDRMLTNIDLLPSLYENIIKRQVIAVEYKPYEEDVRTLIFHPHYLKEYNGRWHLFGHADGQTPEFGYNIALDRIQAKPREVYKIDYVPAPSDFYKDYFKNIVGVSHCPEAKVMNIRIRARTLNIYKLTETKPLHHSQQTLLPYGQHEDGEYGEFSVRVEINNEFIGRILQMGDGFEIVAPDEARDFVRQRVESLAKLYK